MGLRMVRALIIEPDGSAAISAVGSDLEHIRESIGGGWLEGVSGTISGDWHAYCDEEGKLKGLPFNAAATTLARSLGWPTGDFLHGPVIFLGNLRTPEGVEEGHVPDSVLALARRLHILRDREDDE